MVTASCGHFLVSFFSIRRLSFLSNFLPLRSIRLDRMRASTHLRFICNGLVVLTKLTLKVEEKKKKSPGRLFRPRVAADAFALLSTRMQTQKQNMMWHDLGRNYAQAWNRKRSGCQGRHLRRQYQHAGRQQHGSCPQVLAQRQWQGYFLIHVFEIWTKPTKTCREPHTAHPP